MPHISPSLFEQFEESEKENPNMTRQEIVTKIAGVSFEGRQQKILKLKQKDKLELKREPENKYDKNAVAVINPSNKDHLGYIERKLAPFISKRLESGEKFMVFVVEIQGGYEDPKMAFDDSKDRYDEKIPYGCKILIKSVGKGK